MTRDEQLELVARNIGEWPNPEEYIGVQFQAGLEDGYIVFMEEHGFCGDSFSIEEAEAKCREITGEPDDKDAPDWANWKAQDKNGEWFWCEYEPEAITIFYRAKGRFCQASKGEVLGDWRDTLKQVKREEKEVENVGFVWGEKYKLKSGSIDYKFVGTDPENYSYGIFVPVDHRKPECFLLSDMDSAPSERDEFAGSVRGVFYDAYHSDGELPSIALADDDAEAYGKAIFDAISEGRLKAPEVKK